MPSPRWIVTCPECKVEFTHTDVNKIASAGTRDLFASPPKPEIPDGGSEVKCHNCGKTSTYKAVDLRYRED